MSAYGIAGVSLYFTRRECVTVTSPKSSLCKFPKNPHKYAYPITQENARIFLALYV